MTTADTSDDLVAIELSAEEWRLLSCGLNEWRGPADCTEELAVAMGFAGCGDFRKEIQERLLPLLSAECPLPWLDWVRILLATEIAFASAIVGSGRDWQVTVGVSDEESIQLLRALQAKIVPQVWSRLEAFGRIHCGFRRLPSQPAAEPHLSECLAYAVLIRPAHWLGMASPTALHGFLAGAELRAAATQPTLPRWRIHGPLRDADFDEPLIAKSGHPSLSIRWPTALELTHFSMPDAIAELRKVIRERFASGRVGMEAVGSSPKIGPTQFWRRAARRPGMYFGGVSGWHLGWYLAGLTKGGDWLGLPPYPQADEIAEAIQKTSQRMYGSEFGGYRICSAQQLLAWAGVEPLEDSAP